MHVTRASTMTVSAFLIGAFGCSTGWDYDDHSPPLPSPTLDGHATAAPVAVQDLSACDRCAPMSFAGTVQKAKDAVVNISTTQVVAGGLGFPFDLFADPLNQKKQVREGLGTGFVIDSKQGLIVTNNHVIEGASEIIVQLADRREFPAGVVGRDKPVDLAILKIPEPASAQLSLGDSDTLRVGDWVIAIGNPIGLSHTVTAGVVSALGRSSWDMRGELPGYADFIQTDASINPGNSGGPLLDVEGRVVGINSAIIRGNQGVDVQGIGFAIPVNMLKTIKDELIAKGRLSRSWMGVLLAPVDSTIAKNLGMSAPEGAVIGDIVTGGPADAAGLEPNDVILEFGDTVVKDGRHLPWIISMTKPGIPVKLKILRQGKPIDEEVVLVPMPESY